MTICFFHNINVKEVFDASSMVRTLIDNGLAYAIFDHFLLVRSKHAHASYPGLSFRPRGFSPYMGQEERRGQALD